MITAFVRFFGVVFYIFFFQYVTNVFTTVLYRSIRVDANRIIHFVFHGFTFQTIICVILLPFFVLAKVEFLIRSRRGVNFTKLFANHIFLRFGFAKTVFFGLFFAGWNLIYKTGRHQDFEVIFLFVLISRFVLVLGRVILKIFFKLVIQVELEFNMFLINLNKVNTSKD